MKIMDNGIVREMTPKEEAEFEEWRRNTPPPDSPDAEKPTTEDKAEAYDILMGEET